MDILFIRHGMTEGNRQSRYIGRTDEPLSPEGILQARGAVFKTSCTRVYVSPLKRTGQTAAILFPEAEQVIVEGFREMDFGVFENRNAEEMVQDPQYREWINGMCTSRCPGGESRAEFCARVCNAFTDLIASLRAEYSDTAVLVVHGGTIMAILERFSVPKKDYFDYRIGNCGVFHCRLVEGPFLVLSVLECRDGLNT